MKKKILLLIISSTLMIHAQQKIHFEYDLAGNQISRQFCLNCFAKANIVAKNVDQLKENDFQKFHPNDNFSFYPNPVKEELFLKWEDTMDSKIQLIELFDLKGMLLETYIIQSNFNNANIAFNKFPNGVYIIRLKYQDENEKIIKIIKE
ncbi:T9SS type A sorting domain-containing protein [Flavobacterium branchiophilum]|uniref:Secretion system C-terminal sorting domain-containing protein n=2 Tax=Flavobacterium branchiophilum TaxID=55197 RepID=A0A2H3KAR5_9FLAO|nr:T9SS type A sorting domain-containing protein [Flavobacterium branchiophilum]PDS22571.1 hypothetical protein B0A77_13065 [Flavobacterium branchiophilum]